MSKKIDVDEITKNVPTCDYIANVLWEDGVIKVLRGAGLHYCIEESISCMLDEFVESKKPAAYFRARRPPLTEGQEGDFYVTPGTAIGSSLVMVKYRYDVTRHDVIAIEADYDAASMIIWNTLSQTMKCEETLKGFDKEKSKRLETKELWDAVHALLKKPEPWIRVRIAKQLGRLKMSEKELPLDFLKRAMVEINNAALSGNRDATDYPAWIILESLPDSWEHLIRSFRSDSQVTMSKINSLMEAEHAKRKDSLNKKRARDEDDQIQDGIAANYGETDKPPPPKKPKGDHTNDRSTESCTFCGRRYHTQSECYFDPSSPHFSQQKVDSFINRHKNTKSLNHSLASRQWF
jgi:hypothetical protein